MEMSALKIWWQLKYLLCNKCTNDMAMHSNPKLIRTKEREQINVKLRTEISICGQFQVESFWIFHTCSAFGANDSYGICLCVFFTMPYLSWVLLPDIIASTALFSQSDSTICGHGPRLVITNQLFVFKLFKMNTNGFFRINLSPFHMKFSSLIFVFSYQLVFLCIKISQGSENWRNSLNLNLNQFRPTAPE